MANVNRLGFFNVIILLLSIYVLGALLIDTLFEIDPETSILLNYIDNTICIFFFLDFCICLYKAENRLRYLRWGWIDLISSIPAIDFLRIGRLFKLIRLLRIVKSFRTIKKFVDQLFVNRVEGTVASVISIAILVIIFSSIAILQFERVPEGNIKTAEDAVWWTYTTITTVGYGDKYPVTTEGRIVAVFLMTVGVGIFGTFTAYVASYFVASKENDKKGE